MAERPPTEAGPPTPADPRPPAGPSAQVEAPATGGAAATGGNGGSSGGAGGTMLSLTSPAFENVEGCATDNVGVCDVFPDENVSYMDNANVSPELHWADVPEGTQSFAVVLFDVTFGQAHWVLWNIPAEEVMLAANVPKDVKMPATLPDRSRPMRTSPTRARTATSVRTCLATCSSFSCLRWRCQPSLLRIPTRRCWCTSSPGAGRRGAGTGAVDGSCSKLRHDLRIAETLLRTLRQRCHRCASITRGEHSPLRRDWNQR